MDERLGDWTPEEFEAHGQEVLALLRDYFAGIEDRPVLATIPPADLLALLDRPLPQASSAALAAQLLGRETRPSVAAVREERKRRLQEALNAMDPLDQEVLVLRHFEDLTNAEVARELDLQVSAASKRYIRALRKLEEILAALPGGGDEFR